MLTRAVRYYPHLFLHNYLKPPAALLSRPDWIGNEFQALVLFQR